jgi:dolichol-phosphate mannosyltransferase
MAAALLMALFYLAAYLRAPAQAPSGFMTLLLAVIFLGSVQMICLSILATYLGHIYDEVKRRPRYIVRDIVDRRPALADRRGAAKAARVRRTRGK